MPSVTTIFAREQNLYRGNGSVPINIDYFLGLGNRTKYTYDEFDRLVHKQVEDFVTESFKQDAYVYDGQDMVLKFARGDENALVASDLKTRYLHGAAVDQILAEESVSSLSTAGNVYWMLGDHEGTIRDVADYNTGTNTTSVDNHLQYASFGEIRGEDGTYTPTFTYTGRQYDADSELYYNRARWYDAKVGKFISKDPIGFAAGDANLNRYCHNNPTNFIDPSGLLNEEYARYSILALGAEEGIYTPRIDAMETTSSLLRTLPGTGQVLMVATAVTGYDIVTEKPVSTLQQAFDIGGTLLLGLGALTFELQGTGISEWGPMGCWDICFVAGTPVLVPDDQLENGCMENLAEKGRFTIPDWGYPLVAVMVGVSVFGWEKESKQREKEEKRMKMLPSKKRQ